jgi:hypothetical protein
LMTPALRLGINCGCSSKVEHVRAKHEVRVRSSSPALGVCGVRRDPAGSPRGAPIRAVDDLTAVISRSSLYSCEPEPSGEGHALQTRWSRVRFSTGSQCARPAGCRRWFSKPDVVGPTPTERTALRATCPLTRASSSGWTPASRSERDCSVFDSRRRDSRAPAGSGLRFAIPIALGSTPRPEAIGYWPPSGRIPGSPLRSVVAQSDSERRHCGRVARFHSGPITRRR